MAVSTKKQCRRPAHNYGAELKLAACSLISSGAISMKRLSKVPHFPSRSVLSVWYNAYKAQGEDAFVADKTREADTRSLLKTSELELIGGWAMYTLKNLRFVTIGTLRDFVAAAFGFEASDWWLHTHITRLGFSSQRIQPQPLKYLKKNSTVILHHWLVRFRHQFHRHNNRSQVVALDQISIWNNDICAKTYAPLGW